MNYNKLDASERKVFLAILGIVIVLIAVFHNEVGSFMANISAIASQFLLNKFGVDGALIIVFVLDLILITIGKIVEMKDKEHK